MSPPKGILRHKLQTVVAKNNRHCNSKNEKKTKTSKNEKKFPYSYHFSKNK